jgi:hypothetical protein
VRAEPVRARVRSTSDRAAVSGPWRAVPRAGRIREGSKARPGGIPGRFWRARAGTAGGSGLWTREAILG